MLSCEQTTPLGEHPDDWVPYTIDAFARLVGVHPNTLRNWDRQGFLVAHRRPTLKGERFYYYWHYRSLQQRQIREGARSRPVTDLAAPERERVVGPSPLAQP